MKISIALCTYNGAKYLTEQLESLKNQTVKADEIIVCDDCSKDNTIEILKKYKDVLNIKIFINEVNLGVTKNFEKAISLCSGDIIFLCDQDDIWEKNKIEKMSSSFVDSTVGIVLCNGTVIDEKNKQIKNYTLWNSFGIDKINKENFNFEILINKLIFTGVATAFRADLKEYFLPISKNSFHDEWIGFICAYKSKLCFLKEKLVNYRIHKNQKIGIIYIKSLYEKYKFVKKYKISDIEKELAKVNDFIEKFQQLNAEKTFINKLKNKQRLFYLRATRSKFRLFILLWQLMIGNYHLYTNGKFKTFIRDVLTTK